jgi:tetratricopeptide (TPR) repeat protein
VVYRLLCLVKKEAMKIKFFPLAKCGILATAVFCSPLAVLAQPKSPPSKKPSAAEAATEKSFRAGNTLMEKRHYAPALAAYQSALAKAPDEPSLLWNGGLAGYLSGDYGAALSLWQRLKKQEPRDGEVRAKLIQTYQALKKRRERDAERTQLFALRAEAKKHRPTAEALKQKEYCRDQFTTAGRQVFAYESFEMEGERARRYNFRVFGKGADSEDFHISLGSYADTNDFMRETGELKAGERIFHLDGYYPRGLHKTFSFFKTEPSYDQTRLIVEEIVAGKRSPISSSVKGSH